MMSEDRKPTAHQVRVLQVRERCKKVIAKIEAPRRRGGFTVYGVFAERAWKIALERGINVSKASEVTSTGVPKDLATGLRNFVDGKTGTHEARLDVFELACIEFETEAREAAQERRTQLRVVGSTPEASEAASGPEDAPLVVTEQGRHIGTFGRVDDELAAGRANAYTPPDEFDAARLINDCLSDFDTVTAKRILSYVETRIAAREEPDGA